MIRELLPKIFRTKNVPAEVEEELFADVFGEIGIVMHCQGENCQSTRSVPGKYVISMLVDFDSAYIEAETDKTGSCGTEGCVSTSYGRVLLEAANISCAVTMVKPEHVAVISDEIFAST